MDIQSFESSLRHSISELEHSIFESIARHSGPAFTDSATSSGTTATHQHITRSTSASFTGTTSPNENRPIPTVPAPSLTTGIITRPSTRDNSTLKLSSPQSSSIMATTLGSPSPSSLPSTTSHTLTATSPTQGLNSTQVTASPQAGHGKRSQGLILGVVIGGVLVLVALVAITVWIINKRRKNHRRAQPAQPPTVNTPLSDSPRGRRGLEILQKNMLPPGSGDQTPPLQSAREIETAMQHRIEILSQRITDLEVRRHELEYDNDLPEYTSQ